MILKDLSLALVALEPCPRKLPPSPQPWAALSGKQCQEGNTQRLMGSQGKSLNPGALGARQKTISKL